MSTSFHPIFLLKQALLTFVLFFIYLFSYGQIDTSNPPKSSPQDSLIHSVPVKPKTIKKKPLLRKIIIHDTIPKKPADTLKAKSKDTLSTLVIPPSKFTGQNTRISIQQILKRNIFLNLSDKPVYQLNKLRQFSGKEILFYIVCAFLILFGIFKVFYARYFFNVFKVFFNTSLRQNQLTDILLQARLASMIFNLLFVVSTGFYLWLLLIYQGVFTSKQLIMLPIAMGVIFLIYIIKFLIIRFLGWLTNYKEAASQYVFIIFLINKMVGVFLIPFIILLAFGPEQWKSSLVLLSTLLIATLFLLRYFRTYGLLQKQLSLNLFHFILYLVGIEILPIVALYQLFQSLRVDPFISG